MRRKTIQNSVHNTPAGKSVAIGIASMAHPMIFLRIAQQFVDDGKDRFLFCTGQPQGSSSNAFGTFGSIPQYLSLIHISGVYVIYALVRSQAEYEVGLYLVMIIQIVANVFYIEFVNEAKENYGFIMVKTMIVRLLYLASIFIFVRKADDILPYAIVVSATVLLNNLISYVYLKRNIRFNFKNIEIVRHIAPLIVSLLLTNVEILLSLIHI